MSVNFKWGRGGSCGCRFVGHDEVSCGEFISLRSFARGDPLAWWGNKCGELSVLWGDVGIVYRSLCMAVDEIVLVSYQSRSPIRFRS